MMHSSIKGGVSAFDSISSTITSSSIRYHASLGELTWIPVLVANSSLCILPTYVCLQFQQKSGQ